VTGVRMPDEIQLPPGPKRDLVSAVHGLYERAGKPAVRTISARIHERCDLPGTLSHEGVSALLRGNGKGVPRWLTLESLVRVLVERQRVGGGGPDVEAILLQIHQLWCIADGGPVIPREHRAGLSANATSVQDPGPDREPDGAVPGPELQDDQKPPDSLPLVLRWNVRQRTVDIYDRQVAVEVIKEVGGVDERP
jgi:hypothetical protein